MMNKKQLNGIQKSIFENEYRTAIRKMLHFLKKNGNYKRHKIKQHNLIYEYSILIGEPIENPTRKSCAEWLYNKYKEQKEPSLLKVEVGFYQTIEWKRLRIKVFDLYGYSCMKCNNQDFLHIDHIKPRSLFPELELDINNMQVLCKSCNSSKSNRVFTDYRK